MKNKFQKEVTKNAKGMEGMKGNKNIKNLIIFSGCLLVLPLSLFFLDNASAGKTTSSSRSQVSTTSSSSKGKGPSSTKAPQASPPPSKPQPEPKVTKPSPPKPVVTTSDDDEFEISSAPEIEFGIIDDYDYTEKTYQALFKNEQPKIVVVDSKDSDNWQLSATSKALSIENKPGTEIGGSEITLSNICVKRTVDEIPTEYKEANQIKKNYEIGYPGGFDDQDPKIKLTINKQPIIQPKNKQYNGQTEIVFGNQLITEGEKTLTNGVGLLLPANAALEEQKQYTTEITWSLDSIPSPAKGVVPEDTPPPDSKAPPNNPPDSETPVTIDLNRIYMGMIARKLGNIGEYQKKYGNLNALPQYDLKDEDLFFARILQEVIPDKKNKSKAVAKYNSNRISLGSAAAFSLALTDKSKYTVEQAFVKEFDILVNQLKENIKEIAKTDLKRACEEALETYHQLDGSNPDRGFYTITDLADLVAPYPGKQVTIAYDKFYNKYKINQKDPESNLFLQFSFYNEQEIIVRKPAGKKYKYELEIICYSPVKIVLENASDLPTIVVEQEKLAKITDAFHNFEGIYYKNGRLGYWLNNQDVNIILQMRKSNILANLQFLDATGKLTKYKMKICLQPTLDNQIPEGIVSAGANTSTPASAKTPPVSVPVQFPITPAEKEPGEEGGSAGD